MKNWPKKFIHEMVRRFLLVVIVMVGVRTIVEYLIFNDTQTKTDVIDSLVIGTLMACFFTFPWNGWDSEMEKYRKLARYREEEQSSEGS